MRLHEARPLWHKDDCLILWSQWCFACIAKQVELLNPFFSQTKEVLRCLQFVDSSQLALLFGNFPVGLVLLWGLKKGDFLAPKKGSKNRSKRRPPKPQTKRKITIAVCSAKQTVKLLLALYMRFVSLEPSEIFYCLKKLFVLRIFQCRNFLKRSGF